MYTYNCRLIIFNILALTQVEMEIMNFNVSLTVVDKNNITLTGMENDLKQAERRIDKKRLEIALRNNDTQEFPDTWTQTDQDFSTFQLAENSNEFMRVSNLFKDINNGIPTANIKRIERIQNKQLYKQYNFQKNHLDDLNKNSVKSNELELFHGTRNTDPTNIYQNVQNSFDFKFSSGGMWGRGSYFAVNSKYSHGYAWNIPNTDEKQMFLATVLIGDTISLPSDKNITMPPPRQQNPGLRHDSVQGLTGGSVIYIVYQDHRSYPRYLITYT